MNYGDVNTIRIVRKSKENEIVGMIFNLQKYSLEDGPGIRTTVFMKGCPLCCLWCFNPESQNKESELFYFDEKCIECDACVKVCPEGAIKKIKSKSKGKYKINRDICTKCGKCVEVCPSQALQLIGKLVTVNELFNEIEKDKIFYNNSNGGVTISGGEPLAQPIFVEKILKKCQIEGIHTAIETCGFAKKDVLERILKYTDLVLIDIKHINSKIHKKLTGVSNELILNNIKILDKSKVPFILRVPIIPGYNDSKEEIQAMADFIKNLQFLKKICLLPYRQLGETKYKRLGRNYELKGLKTPSFNHLKNIKSMLSMKGLRVQIGG